jgi:murein DD-endopeptidase MepM/ murein hydrolase activator NlpD
MAMVLAFAALAGITGAGGADNSREMPQVPVFVDEIIPGTAMRMSEVPESISLDSILESNHVARIYELETDLSSIVFRNADDTNTMYMFGLPVQFVDENGTVRDKSNRLHSVASTDSRSRAYAYSNRDNDVRTYFPRTLNASTGILLTDGNFTVERTPIFDGGLLSRNSASVDNRATSVEDNWVYYDGVFGRHTALRYSPTFEGFKEEVVLYRNVGQNRFDFTVRTNGLTLVYDGGEFSFVDPATRDVVGNIGGIWVYDSSDDPYSSTRLGEYRHFYEMSVVRENEEYCVTIVVDEQYLERATYPVFVDPVTRLDPFDGTRKQIQDATIIGNNPQQLGRLSWLSVGRWDAFTYRTLISFPGLATNATLRHIPSSQITNASLFLTTIEPVTTSTNVRVHRSINQDWNESTVHGNSDVWNATQESINPVTIPAGVANRSFSWNITQTVQHWNEHQTNNLLRRGIILVNNNETDPTREVLFHSTEHTITSRRPRLEVTWSGFAYMLNDDPVPPDVLASHISSGYGFRGDDPNLPSGATTDHRGIDIVKRSVGNQSLPLRHEPVYSIGAGRVVFIKRNTCALGNYVVVELNARHPSNGNRLLVGYAHLERIDDRLTGTGVVNHAIPTGRTIGTVGGSNGTTSGGAVHLHFQVMTHDNNGTFTALANYSNSVNPVQYFPQITFTTVGSNWWHRTHRRTNNSSQRFVPHPQLP